MLSRVQALNYRCLRYLDCPLLPFQILIGPNASGKSSFLDVVALLGDYVREGLDHALLQTFQNPTGRSSHVDQLIFNQSGPGFELAIELKVPKAIYSSYEYARYEVGVEKKESGELAIAGETLWLHNTQPTHQNTDRQYTLFPMEIQAPETILTVTGPGKKKPSSKKQWRKVVSKIVKSGNDYYKDESGNWNMTFRVGTRKSALGGLPQDEDRFPIALWVRDLLREGIHILALNSIAMRRPCSPSESKTFKVDGSNLPLVVQDLQQNPEAFQDWVEHMQTVLPDLETILVEERPEDKHLYLAIKYNFGGDPVPSWLLSDGTLRMLALTLLAYMDMPSPGIYLIEEPENGIHPKAIEAVFLSLASVYDSQIFLATHSPLFLDLAKRKQLLCFAKNTSGAIDIVSGDNHPALREWKGQIFLSTLYASGVLG